MIPPTRAMKKPAGDFKNKDGLSELDKFAPAESNTPRSSALAPSKLHRISVSPSRLKLVLGGTLVLNALNNI
jgi:hypothetical protein